MGLFDISMMSLESTLEGQHWIVYYQEKDSFTFKVLESTKKTYNNLICWIEMWQLIDENYYL